MTELPKKTINANNSKLGQAMSAFREKYMEPFDEIIFGKRPEFTFNKMAAERIIQAYTEIDMALFEQNIQMGAYVMSIKSCAELIEEYGLEEIEEKVFPEQLDALKKLFKYISILNNYKAVQNDEPST